MRDKISFCFFTTFVCRYDQLDQAKLRHQRCVDVLRDHFGYKIHFSSEQAYQLGQSQPIFDLLLSEIVGSDLDIPQEEKEEYSAFCFVTVVDIPPCLDNTEDIGEEVRKIAVSLEIDFETDFPARFPSRTRGMMVSATGHEVEGCIYQ